MSGEAPPADRADCYVSHGASGASDRHTDTTVPAPAPAASVPKETDEDVAKRLSHELNVTGRARKAPAPSYVPAPIKPGLDRRGQCMTQGEAPRKNTGRTVC